MCETKVRLKLWLRTDIWVLPQYLPIPYTTTFRCGRASNEIYSHTHTQQWICYCVFVEAMDFSFKWFNTRKKMRITCDTRSMKPLSEGSMTASNNKLSLQTCPIFLYLIRSPSYAIAQHFNYLHWTLSVWHDVDFVNAYILSRHSAKNQHFMIFCLFNTHLNATQWTNKIPIPMMNLRKCEDFYGMKIFRNSKEYPWM